MRRRSSQRGKPETDSLIPPSIVAHLRKSPIKESRPTRRNSGEMAVLRSLIYKTLSEIQPASVRQAFYALTVRVRHTEDRGGI
jgi:hypothetical protein